MHPIKVIFACVHNAGRSQMAVAFFNHYADSSKIQAVSAGTHPVESIHDSVSMAMKQVGIDISRVKPQLLTDDIVKGASHLITMGCGEECPYLPGMNRDDWPIPDPKDKSEIEVCEIRDQIKNRVMRLLQDLNAAHGATEAVPKRNDSLITDDDRHFLDSFEQCSLGSKCWNHAAHIRMAWLILETSFSFDQALSRIRTGIQRFNSTNNSIGYHETITVAFARIIDSRRSSGDSWQMFSEKNADLFEKTVLEKFYSTAVLGSQLARESFVEPDRSQF